MQPSPQSPDCEVLVVGAGPTGLATALALKAQGVAVRIVDAAPDRHREARASAIHARTLELLAPFGVADRLVAYANPFQEVAFFGPDGALLHRNRPGPIDSPYPPMQNLQQWRTESLLADQLAAVDLAVERSSRVVRVAQDGEGVEATLEAPTGIRALRARFLVAADGARSTVRHSLGVRMEGGDYPERWIAGELEVAGPFASSRAEVLFDSDRVALRFPLAGGYLFFATLPAGELPEAKHGPADPAEVRRIHDRTFGRFPQFAHPVAAVPWTGFFTMHHCALPDYRQGRIFLAGDAAHLTSAAGGNGMNAGIQDGINLAWRLAAHLRLGAREGILDGYSRDRHEMFDWINAGSDAAHRLLAAHDPAAFRLGKVAGVRAWIGGILAQLTQAGPREADRALGETSFAYTRDPALVDRAQRAGTVRAGMRVPPTADLSVGHGAPRPWSALYDGRNWTVLLVVPAREQVPSGAIETIDQIAVRRLRGRVRLVVSAGDALRWNGGRPTLYLVRPDGYVALRVDAAPGALPPAVELEAWLDVFFPGTTGP